MVTALTELNRTSFIYNFTCAIDHYNRQILADRALIKSYLARLENGGKIEDSEHIRMIEIMIKNRMHPAPRGIKYTLNGVYYFSAARFHSPKARDEAIGEKARELFAKNGPSTTCMAYNDNIPDRAVNLKSSKCSEELLKRVDVIPPSMIVAQAVDESKSGESGWVKNENNFLGLQTKFTNPDTMPQYPGCRQVKKDRHRCALIFDKEPLYYGTIDEYANRVNASPIRHERHKEGYPDFRNMRREMRLSNLINRDGKMSCSTAKEFTGFLKVYSERGDYPNKIKKLMDQTCVVCET